jgi:hypothetical protein
MRNFVRRGTIELPRPGAFPHGVLKGHGFSRAELRAK